MFSGLCSRKLTHIAFSQLIRFKHRLHFKSYNLGLDKLLKGQQATFRRKLLCDDLKVYFYLEYRMKSHTLCVC